MGTFLSEKEYYKTVEDLKAGKTVNITEDYLRYLGVTQQSFY